MEDNGLATLFRLADAVNGFLDNGLVPVIYDNFWKGMPDPIQAASYLTVLITKWLALETGDSTSLPELVKKTASKDFDAPSDAGKLNGEESESRTLLLTTIYFVTLYYPFDANFEPLKTALQRWIKLRTRAQKAMPFVDEVLRMLAPNYIHGKEGIRGLVEQGALFSFANDFLIDTAPVGLMAPCFINVYLRKLFLEGKDDSIKYVFEMVLLFLSRPPLIEKPGFLLCLLHMLRTFISLSPSPDASVIEDALTYVRSYYLWPCPYGEIARELLQLLTVESKAPGSAWRTKFIEENPELERGYAPTGKERTVHVLLDDTSEQGRRLQQIIQSSKPEDVSIGQMQIHLLLNILEVGLQIDTDLLGLEYCGKEEIASFYYTAVEILNQAILMSEKDAEVFREEKLTMLKDYIISRSINNRRTAVSLYNLTKKSCSSPPLIFDFLPIEPNETPTLFETDARYPHRTSTDILLHILKQYHFPDRPSPVVVRIGIAGNDRTLHDVVGSYICLRMWKPTLFTNVQLQFYILPVEHSNVATFLAKNDAWYGRHVYCLSHCILHTHPIIIPKARGDAEGRILKSKKEGDKKASTAGKPLTPSLLVRTELQNYFREAHNQVNINIYQVECYAVGGAFLYTIPFYQKAVLGYEAQARAFLATNNIPWDERVGVKDLDTKIKSFKYQPAQMAIRFLQMNVSGQPRQGPVIPDKSYYTIMLSNIPVHGDRCTPPDPSKPWLEMYTLDADRKKKTKVSDEHVYHISQLEIDYKEKDKRREGFYMVLDSVLYGPFERVKIGMCLTSSKEEMECHKLPVMTYFPLVL